MPLIAKLIKKLGREPTKDEIAEAKAQLKARRQAAADAAAANEAPKAPPPVPAATTSAQKRPAAAPAAAAAAKKQRAPKKLQLGDGLDCEPSAPCAPSAPSAPPRPRASAPFAPPRSRGPEKECMGITKTKQKTLTSRLRHFDKNKQKSFKKHRDIRKTAF